MINFSPGVAQGCFELLGIVSRSSLSVAQIGSAFSHFSAMRSGDIVAFAQDAGWIRSAEEGTLELTPSGSKLLALEGYGPMLRQALMDYVDACRPPWVQGAAFGRSRVMAFAGGGVAQVIVEAGLGASFDDDVVAFWDSLAARARGLRDTSLSRIGRIGEKLTITHEEARTGRKPKWVAINNNADGYDVLSVVEKGDLRSLSIEVKTTSQGMLGSIHLTRNEWEMAQERSTHVFHLWDIQREPARLAKVSVSDMADHVPSDTGAGLWESASIPVAAFTDVFRTNVFGDA